MDETQQERGRAGEDAAGAAVWAQLALLAHRICEHIEKRQPDLIVPVQETGAVVWAAAEALWRATRNAPLPRVAAARLDGKAAYTGARFYEPDYPAAEMAGEFMAGLLRMRPQWPAALAAQIGAEVGDERVRRVLVVDDCIRHGDTLLAAGSLLLAVFPHAEVDLLAGLEGGWSTTLAKAWLEAHHPAAERMRENWPEDRLAFDWFYRPSEPGNVPAGYIAGLAPVEDAPFASRPMTAADFDSPYLLRYLPAEAWLDFPASVRAEAARRTPAAGDLAGVQLHRRVWYGMGQEERFYALTWSTPFFTAEELAERSGYPPDKAGELLQRVELVTQQVEGRMVYTHEQKTGLLDYEGLPALRVETASPWVTLHREVTTPFAVEFAATSADWGGGPTLAVVPAGQGAPVRAQLYGFHPLLDEDDEAMMALHRAVLDAEKEAAARTGTAPAGSIEKLDRFENLYAVYYVQRPATLTFISDETLGAAEKAERLARLAVESLHGESGLDGRDGILYLAQAMGAGVETPLTALYAAAVLRLAGGARSLEEARERLVTAG